VSKGLRGPRKRLIALQDLLGELNDAVVARANIRTWIAEPNTALPPRVLFLLGKLEKRLRSRGELD
jgi:CHAD domain-containing protein